MDRNLQSPCHVGYDHYAVADAVVITGDDSDEHQSILCPAASQISSSSNNYYVDFAAAVAVPRKTRTSHMHRTLAIVKANKVSLRGGGETICPPPHADGSSTTAEIAADLRPSADGSAVRTFLVASGAQAAANFFRLTGWFEQHYGCFSAKPKNI